jgi:uncharacterized protein YdcH (DUF465 family)
MPRGGEFGRSPPFFYQKGRIMNIEKTERHIKSLCKKHTELAERIEVLEAERVDDLIISKFKQEKLRLKDEITHLERSIM